VATKKPGKTRKTAKASRAPAARRAGVKRSAAKSAPARAAAKKATARAAEAASGRVPRRAIFIDVENTSSEDALTEVLDSLKIDRATQPVELTAVGNWRAAAQRLARHLASLGAQLVHSAPAPGVKDWSDLWIAVAAGCWLGQSAPGDVLEIVSNDRAFDAVGDAAAARGVIFRRLLHRRGGGAVHVAAEPKPAAASRRSRGGRRRRRGRSDHALPATAVPAPAARPAHGHPQHAPAAHAHAAHAHAAHAHAAHVSTDEPHGASREQMLALIGRLTNGDHGRWINLDVLEKALKAEGFSRPPGSPRLVTRLRTLKEVEIDSHGRVRLVQGAEPPRAQKPAAEARPKAPEADDAPAPAAPAKRRRRRRSKSNGGADATPAPIETQPE
jgi:hypothetical protein